MPGMPRFTTKDLLLITAVVAIEAALLITMLSKDFVITSIVWIFYGAVVGGLLPFFRKRGFTIAGIFLGCILGILTQCFIMLIGMNFHRYH
jgi:hypothetical protein